MGDTRSTIRFITCPRLLWTPRPPPTPPTTSSTTPLSSEPMVSSEPTVLSEPTTALPDTVWVTPVLVWVTPVTAWDSLVMVSLEPSPPSSPLLPSNKKRKSQEWTTKELLTCCRNMNNTKHEFASCFMSSHSIRCIYFCFLLIFYNQPSLKF